MFVGGRRLGLVPVAMALALSLAGCGGSSDKARSLPPLSTSPSTAPSASPSPSPKAAAVAVVRAYFRAKNSLATDKRASALDVLISRRCACRVLVQSARELAHHDQHYFGRAHLTQVIPTDSTVDRVQVLVRYDSTKGGVEDAAGHVISHDPPHRGVKQLFLVRLVNGYWLVDKILLIQGGN